MRDIAAHIIHPRRSPGGESGGSLATPEHLRSTVKSQDHLGPANRQQLVPSEAQCHLVVSKNTKYDQCEG